MLRLIKLKVCGIRSIKSRKTRWAVQVAFMEGKQNARSVLVRKTKSEETTWNTCCRWEDTVKMSIVRSRTQTMEFSLV
jgi:hypothetical protein